MKKNFFALSLYAILFLGYSAYADVQFLGDPNLNKVKTENHKSEQKSPERLVLPDFSDEEATREFFKERLENAIPANLPEGEDIHKSSSSSIMYSQEALEVQNQDSKSTFQKIYEEALEAIHKDDANKNDDNTGHAPTDDATIKEATEKATRFFIMAPQNKEVDKAENNRFPTVNVTLPSGRQILAPALEHIPYYLSYIDIQSNGYVKVEDTITIVANNKKFQQGLTRSFPKYTYYLGKRGHRVELILDGVTVNGTKVPYTMEEIGNNIVMRPKYNQSLESGVYTYKFNYFINNKLQKTSKLVFLDWTIKDISLNAFITSANAIVSLPEGYAFKDRAALISRNGEQTTLRTNIFRFAKNVQAFSNNTPLLPGEEMHIIAVMDKNIFIKKYDRNFSSFLNDWGDIFYAVLGFIVIIGAFAISLISLKNERKKNKYRPSYNGSLLRNIYVGKYDRTAFISQLLDLYRKGAVDMEKEDNRFYLLLKDIKNDKLNKNERKGLKMLFAKKTKRIEFSRANNVKIKKAHTFFEKCVKKQIKQFRLKQNIGYVLFSIFMLLASETAIASLNVNFAQSLTIMLTASLLYAFYIWILLHRFKYLVVTLPIKIFALTAIASIWIFCSVYTGGITGILIIGMIASIFAFAQIFNEHNNFINEAREAVDNFKEYLISNADAINLSKDFFNQQSNIFALNISEYFPCVVSNKNSYKLDIAEELKQTLTNIF